MTQFLTTTDFAARVPLAADFAPDVVAAAVADANGTVEAYTSNLYPLMPSPVPPLLVSIATDIAVRKLYRTDVAEGVADAYTLAIKQLTDISTGRTTLRLPANTPDAEETLIFSGSDIRRAPFAGVVCNDDLV